METRWHPFHDRNALEDDALARIERAALQAIGTRGEFTIVLAGGGTPRGVYERLQGIETQWTKWRVYFGDERCVPLNDEMRNDRMAHETLLDHVPIAADAIHRIPAEQGAAAAAQAYERTLAGVGPFDLVLLGLGEDGHIASLFPGRELGEAADAPDVLAVFGAPKPPPERVSMSARRLSSASRVLFLVAGESKRDAVQRWKVGEALPAAAIRPAVGVDVLVERGLLNAGPNQFVRSQAKGLRLRARAARNHRSLQRELMAILEAAADSPDLSSARPADRQPRRQPREATKPIGEIIAALRERFPNPPEDAPLRVDIIRAARDER